MCVCACMHMCEIQNTCRRVCVCVCETITHSNPQEPEVVADSRESLQTSRQYDHINGVSDRETHTSQAHTIPESTIVFKILHLLQ